MGGYFGYILFSLPFLLLSQWASRRVKGTFEKFSAVGTSQNMTGAQVARALLDAYGLQNVAVERIAGTLTDHYDPRGKVLRLSEPVYDVSSVAAAGVAAHEMGHALQDADGYAPLRLRGAMVPTVTASSKLAPMIFMGGMLASGFIGGQIGQLLMIVGIGLLAVSATFSLVTLPVEFDASKRAKKLLLEQGLMFKDEIKGVDKVLDAAALTYVAAAVQSVGTILYYVMRMQRRR